MHSTSIHAPTTVLGLAITTSNQEAANTIPAHWGRFFSENTIEKIPNPLSDKVYAIYTNFTNEGVSNEGDYLFIIGLSVPADTTAPQGLTTVSIPSGKYNVFPVETGKPELVFPKWMEIWQNNTFNKSYICDFEVYSSTGEIEIFVGEK